MEPQWEAPGTFIFKVNHESSSGFHCQERTTEELKKIYGVDSVSFDARGLVKVSGNINSKIIVGKFEEWGEKAELFGFQNWQGVCNCPKKCNPESVAFESSDDKSDGVLKPMKKNDDVVGENPSSPEERQSMKRGKDFFGFLGRLFPKKNGAKKKGPKPMMRPWRLPLPNMPESPYELYPPLHESRLAPPYYQYSQIRPPRPPPPRALMLPPHGMFDYMPPPKANPMIHYRSYADNYSYW